MSKTNDECASVPEKSISTRSSEAGGHLANPRGTPKNGSSSETFDKICISKDTSGETVGKTKSALSHRTELGGLPPMVSSVATLPFPNRVDGALDCDSLEAHFCAALSGLGFAPCSLSHARTVVHTLESAAMVVLGRPPLSSTDLLSQDVLSRCIAELKATASSDRRLPLLVRLVVYLHMGEPVMRTGIPECEWVRQACRPQQKRKVPRPRHMVTLDDSKDHPLAQRFIRWLDATNQHWQRAAMYSLRQFCGWLCTCGDFRAVTPVSVNLRQVRPEHLQVYYRFLKAEFEGGKIARGTFGLQIQRIRRWFAYLHVYEGFATDPAMRLPVVKGREKAPWRILSESEVRDVLESTLRHSQYPLRDTALIGCLFSLGLRPSEAVGMTVGDIDWYDATIKVVGKGNRERAVPVPGPLLLEFERYVQSRPQPLDSEDSLWVNNAGGQLSYDSLRSLFHRFKTKAGIDRYVGGPHVGRHFFITENLLAGEDLEDLAAFVGDTNLRSLEPYVHTTDEGIRAALLRAYAEEESADAH